RPGDAGREGKRRHARLSLRRRLSRQTRRLSQERDRQMGRGRAKRLAEVRARGGQLADARIALNVALLRWAVQSSCPSMVPCDSWKLGHPAFLSEGIAAAECLLCPSYLRPVSHQRE